MPKLKGKALYPYLRIPQQQHGFAKKIFIPWWKIRKNVHKGFNKPLHPDLLHKVKQHKSKFIQKGFSKKDVNIKEVLDELHDREVYTRLLADIEQKLVNKRFRRDLRAKTKKRGKPKILFFSKSEKRQ